MNGVAIVFVGNTGVRVVVPPSVAACRLLVYSPRTMENPCAAALANFIKKPPAIAEALSELRTAVQYPLSEDYLGLLRAMNGGEGFVGKQYVRFYSVDQVLLIRRALGEAQLAGDLVVIGSDGGGEALAYDFRQSSAPVVTLGFIPLDYKFVRVLAPTLTAYLEGLRPAEPTRRWFFSRAPKPSTPSPALIDKEIHEIQPIIFGGDPVDPKNKEFLTLSEYLPVVLWWNGLYRDTKNKEEGTSSGTTTA
jgi:hypothetical protein